MGQLIRNFDIIACQLSTATTNSVEVDTAGGEGIFCIGIPGTTAARTWAMSFDHGATTTGFVALASTHTVTSTGAVNFCVVKDWYKPGKRYARIQFGSTTATPSWVVIGKYGLRKAEITSTGFSSTAGLSTTLANYHMVSPSSAT